VSADEILADDAVLARVEADLAGVERAMARLDDGTYEACEVCGQPIGDERLSTAPTETRCSTCAS
jgi:DnaK suppressor protein